MWRGVDGDRHPGGIDRRVHVYSPVSGATSPGFSIASNSRGGANRLTPRSTTHATDGLIPHCV